MNIYDYNDVILSVMASQITTVSFWSGADQRKHQSSASLAFVWREFTGGRWIPRTKGHAVTQKMFPFDYVIVYAATRKDNVVRSLILPCHNWCQTNACFNIFKKPFIKHMKRCWAYEIIAKIVRHKKLKHGFRMHLFTVTSSINPSLFRFVSLFRFLMVRMAVSPHWASSVEPETRPYKLQAITWHYFFERMGPLPTLDLK